MSYILEALKKSDQERKQGHVPDLQTVHMPVILERSHSYWLYIIIVLLLLSLAFVLGWLRPWDRGDEVTQPAAAAVEEPVPQVVAAPRLPASEPAPVVAAVEVATVPDPVSRPVEVRPVEKPRDIQSIPYLEDMPPLVRQSVPELVFAGHVYSSNPQQRSVIINGASMAEGDKLLEGLVLKEISQKGVVFSYQGQLFRMDVLQGWSFD